LLLEISVEAGTWSVRLRSLLCSVICPGFVADSVTLDSCFCYMALY
jgi:hypothetical protein